MIQIPKYRANDKASIMLMFEEQGPINSILLASRLSLSWFIEKVFKNQRGKPLRLLPFQSVVMEMLWTKKLPMLIGTRGMGKSFLLALYSILRCILVPGTKVVIAGAGYRQAKEVFKYIDMLYKASPLIQECAKDRPKYGSDQATFEIGLSSIRAIPIGDPGKVRGIRATVLIADEFSSIPEETYEVVLAPFTATHADPAQRAEVIRFVERLKSLGADKIITDGVMNMLDFGNQIIISGTPSYQVNHFYKRYKIYKAYIESDGDPTKLRKALDTQDHKNVLDQKEIEAAMRMWKQYAIIQMPYTAIPAGFLDEDIIRSNKTTYSPTRFAMEYLAQFPADSEGFIKRSWIMDSTPLEKNGENPVPIELYGDPKAVYVLGLDPARHNDNFAGVVIKITPRGREVVYCVSWNRTDFPESARRIRELCKRFPISYIAMDQGGGGDAVLDLLHHKQSGIDPQDYLWPIRDQIENPIDLAAPGRKIVELVNFTSMTTEIAHDLAASVTNRQILFSYKCDEQSIKEQYIRHFQLNRRLTNEEKTALDCDLWGQDEEIKSSGERTIGVLEELNEMVNETCAIIRDVTPNGVERFILPNFGDQPEGLDMRRRDRFSALMLANYAAKVYSSFGNRPQIKSGIGVNSNAPRLFTRHKKSRGRGSVRY